MTKAVALLALWALFGAIATLATTSEVAAEPLPGTTCSLFPADSVFNSDISALPVNGLSTSWMSSMTQNANLHPGLGTFAQSYGIPINVAPPPTSGVTPRFAYDSESDHPAEGYPIDQNTWIEGGPSAPSSSDRHALVVDKNLCKLYEIYNLQNLANGQAPQAGSGAVWNLKSDAMRPATWTSADAAGLPMAPLLLRPDEILAGSITHAIRFTAHCTTNAYVWPASHQAGSCTSASPPMGARFRLRSNFNFSGFSSNTQVVLRAFQHYGLILADNGSDWFFGGTTDDWWGTAAGSAVVSELKTIPAAQFDAIDESGLQLAANSYQAVSSRTSALPQDRLHFGVGNPGDINWMVGTGVPWRYRYAYLAGGVNTSNPWQNWNSPTGAYATNYMNDSNAHGYVPVFTYYEMLQSTPSTGSNESDRDFSNLNNTSTMASYYGNFKLLMQIAGTYGKTVVVHVEPDLWGYLEQRAAGGDASTLTASVASSGVAEAVGIPNTVQGFAWTLLKIRDMYAPNATLAIHASAWGSGIDIASTTDPNVNAVSAVDATAAFLNSAGITSNPYGSTWDLVFNDLDDHDAGWWEQQGADNANFTHWWDPTNTKFPNFNRYLGWVGELRVKTARPQVAWQVPVGNQYFLTMNNTCGHYQDNVAQYFISHSNDLYNAGLIAVLFGSGNSCQTTYTDGQNDGVTNNGGVPTTDTLGYCSACNTHTSTWADDDGGFLRVFVGQYYAGWSSLGGGLTSGPDAASSGAGAVDVFVRGTDNGLWRLSWNGSSWANWQPLGGGLTSDPGATAVGTRTDVFVRGTDNQLWMKSANSGVFGDWKPLGGVLSSGPDADSWSGPTAHEDVFARGTDGQLWHKWSDNGTWYFWEPLGGGLSADPGAVSWGANRIDVFVRGTDHQLWHKWFDGGRWFGWEPLGGVLTSGPDAASCAPSHLDVFAVGTDGQLWRKGYNGTSWSNWQPAGGQWTSTPSAVCRPTTNSVDLFVRGVDNALWHDTVNGS